MIKAKLYFLHFIHPETLCTLFAQRGGDTVQFVTDILPEVNRLYLFTLGVLYKKKRVFTTWDGMKQVFKVIEVEEGTFSTYLFGSLGYTQAHTMPIYWVKVLPVAEDYKPVMARIKKFFNEHNGSLVVRTDVSLLPI